MSNQVSESEVRRVTEIHRQLDLTVSTGIISGDDAFGLIVNDQYIKYTAQEIRDWPEMKAAMMVPG